jgi:hypothetical protein
MFRIILWRVALWSVPALLVGFLTAFFLFPSKAAAARKMNNGKWRWTGDKFERVKKVPETKAEPERRAA